MIETYGKWTWVLPGLCLIYGCRRPHVDNSRFSRFQANERGCKGNCGRYRPSKGTSRSGYCGIGGESARKKLKTCRITTGSVVTIPIPAAAREMGMDTTRIEDCFRYPDKWRRTVPPSANDKEAMLFIVNGEDYWAKEMARRSRKCHCRQ